MFVDRQPLCWRRTGVSSGLSHLEGLELSTRDGPVPKLRPHREDAVDRGYDQMAHTDLNEEVLSFLRFIPVK